MKKVIIKDVAGNVLHEGRAHTLKEFVSRLVADGRSLARADLRKLNLAHLDLSGGVFDGAAMDGCDLRGAYAPRATFRGADMKGVRASGLNAARSDFTAADLSECPHSGRRSTFDGAVLTYSRFRKSRLRRASFKDASMSGTDFSMAVAWRARFDRATMHNSEWAGAEVTSSSFRDAAMEATLRIETRKLPDRTHGASVAGNDLRGASIGCGNAAFAVDARAGRAAKYVSWAAITAGIAAAGMMLPLDLDLDSLEALAGHGFAFVALASAAVLAKEMAEDAFKDVTAGWLSDVEAAARRAVARAVRRCRSIADMAMAAVSLDVSGLLAAAVGKGSMLGVARAAGGIEVIVCDRKRLARALAEITSSWGGEAGRARDLVILRPSSGGDMNPRALVLGKDGSTRAVWHGRGGWAEASWSVRGEPLVRPDAEGPWQGVAAGRDETVMAFIRAAVVALDLPQIDFDPDTHVARRGRDGSVVVVRRSDGRLVNPHGPVAVSPSGETVWTAGSGLRLP